MTQDDQVLTIAVAQIETRLGDLPANKRTHLGAIDAARAAGAEVLVFPELSLAGHAGGREAPRLALTADSPLLHELAAASGDILTVVGAVEEAPGALFYNSAFGLRAGRVLFRHRKVNLATYGRLDDGKHFAPGSEIRTHEVAAPWRAAILICADLWNPPSSTSPPCPARRCSSLRSARGARRLGTASTTPKDGRSTPAFTP